MLLQFWTARQPHPQKFALTSPTRAGRSVGIVHSRTKAIEFVFYSFEGCDLDTMQDEYEGHFLVIAACMLYPRIACIQGNNMR
jgi:hypothetical protein